MDLTFGEDKKTGDIEAILDALINSGSVADFCRAIVHSEFTQDSVQGCHIYSLNSESQLHQVSGYGRTYQDSNIALSAWDDDPISNSVRNKDVEFVTPSKQSDKGILAIPLLKDSIPVGALALVLDPTVTSVPLHESLIPILSKIGTYCLVAFAGNSVNAFGNYSKASREATGDELTSRQIRILGLMSEGMVNLEIARELMLSESTIRQETVRIYRALGVPNRSEAAIKGRSLGLVKRATPPRLAQLLTEEVK